MIAYFAHPIDMVDPDYTVERLANQVLAAGIGLYRPSHAFQLTKPTRPGQCAGLLRINMAAVEAADLLIGVVGDEPSIGVPIEIWHASQTDTPVKLLVQGRARNSSILSGLENDRSVFSFLTVEGLVTSLKAHTCRY